MMNFNSSIRSCESAGSGKSARHGERSEAIQIDAYLKPRTRLHPLRYALARNNGVFSSFVFFCLAFLGTSLFAQTPHTWETPQHVKVLFYPTQSVPMVTIHIGFKAGSAYDGDTFGLSSLTTEMLDQGSQGLNMVQIAEKIADTGAIFSARAGRDLVAVSLSTLNQSPAFEQAIDVFKQILSFPDFPENALKQQKNQQLAAIRNEQESPDTVALQLFFNTLYQRHPYAHPVLGTEKTVTPITRAQVLKFYKQYFVPENAVMVIVGAIDEAKAKELSATLLAHLPHGQLAASVPKATPYQGPMNIHHAFPSTQTTLYLGQLGIDHHNPDYFPLMVGNYILGGGGLTSELALEVREKQGLTYGVNSEFLPMPGLGPFLISLSTQTEQAANAKHLTEDITSKFLQKGPTQEELIAAKAYMSGSFPLALASNTDIAQMLLKIAFYKLPLDFLSTYVTKINAVTVDEVRGAFQKNLVIQNMISVSVGKEKK